MVLHLPGEGFWILTRHPGRTNKRTTNERRNERTNPASYQPHTAACHRQLLCHPCIRRLYGELASSLHCAGPEPYGEFASSLVPDLHLMPDQMPNRMADKMSDSDGMPERMPDTMPDGMLDKMSEYMSGYMPRWGSHLFPTANLLGFNLWGQGVVTRKCTPQKTGTVLEPCWHWNPWNLAR